MIKQYFAFTACFILIGCFTMKVPRLIHYDNGVKLDAVETQKVTQDELLPYIDDIMESQGWIKPNLETEEEIRDRWLTLMTWSAVGALIALIWWYLSHLREIGGVAMMIGGFSIVSGGFAATAEYFWIVAVSVVVFAILLIAGFMLKDWHILPKKRELVKKVKAVQAEILEAKSS